MTDSALKKKKPFYLGKFAFTRKSPGLAEHLAKRGMKDVNIISQWEKIVGIGLARYSVPQKVLHLMGKKTLTVLVFETRIIEYQHQKMDIISRINLVAGYPFIDDIKFLRTRKLPQSRAKIAPVLTAKNPEKHPYFDNHKVLKHEKLQKALERLAHYVIPVAERPDIKQHQSKSLSWKDAAKDLF